MGKPFTVDTLLIAQLESNVAKRWKLVVAEGDAAAPEALTSPMPSKREAARLGIAIRHHRWVTLFFLVRFYQCRQHTPGAEIADDGLVAAVRLKYGGACTAMGRNSLAVTVHAGHFELARKGLDCVMTRSVNDQGHPVVDGKHQSGRELEERGTKWVKVSHVNKYCYIRSDDDSLLRGGRIKIRAMIELPLRPQLLGTWLIGQRLILL